LKKNIEIPVELQKMIDQQNKQVEINQGDQMIRKVNLNDQEVAVN